MTTSHDQPDGLQRRHVAVHALVVAVQRGGQIAHARRLVCMQVTEHVQSALRQHQHQRFQIDDRDMRFVHGFAPLCTAPGFYEPRTHSREPVSMDLQAFASLAHASSPLCLRTSPARTYPATTAMPLICPATLVVAGFG